MKGLHRLTLIALVLSALLLAGTNVLRMTAKDQTIPEIRGADEPLHLSVSEIESRLLQGVTAWDEKDGDLTDRLLVERVEKAEEEGRITVTYAVADSDHHVVTRARTLVCRDYTPPRFSLSRPLRYTVGSGVRVRDRLTAGDVLDGDLSEDIKIGVSSLQPQYEGSYPVTVEVSNSLGDTAVLTLDIEMRSYNGGEPVITLSEYLVYLEPGQEFRPEAYVRSVTGGSAADVTAQVPELRQGVNRVTYSYTNGGGVTGTAVLYLVIE